VASGLDWTCAAARLTNGPLTGHYRVEDGRLPRRGIFISRADVATFFSVSSNTAKHVRQIVGLAR